MNRIIIAGNIGDVELKETKRGNKYARFSIAHHFRNNDGGYENGYMYLVAFGKTAENLAKFKKGSAMEFIGHFSFSSYTNDEGKVVNTTNYFVDSFSLAGNGAYMERKGGDNAADSEE